MMKNTEDKKIFCNQNDILKRITWFRNMSEFYRRTMDDGEFDVHEIEAFEIEKNAFLKLHDLENNY